ncbi:unnamed protein product [Oppiella nova]|uniref:Small ribosomal subunit protein eS21 n=1 Tax=Oppiella nova TaxID=334625 RepID=A0A7R9M0D0_9ACAR|nr:unnamed protein product [Oppiella nova]CAG2168723.1 unnamed protein product [Oppiella nova]
MQDDQGETVDLYIPRKCSASNRIIHAKDHASIQINLAEVDESTGRVTSNHTAYAICGALRRMVYHASIQINLAEVDESTGRVTSNHTAYAICGALRRMGESDDCINRLAKKDSILPKNF